MLDAAYMLTSIVHDTLFAVYTSLFLKGATGFPGSAGRVGPPGSAVSYFILITFIIRSVVIPVVLSQLLACKSISFEVCYIKFK